VEAPTLQHELGRLVAAELLYQNGFPPQATYTLKHALVQDVAYESLLRTTRQQYHRQIATLLETTFAKTVEHQPELLGHRFTAAGLYEPAVQYWRQAGEQALRRSAHQEGIHHLTKGLELWKTLLYTTERTQQELTLLTALGPALMATKGYTAPDVKRIYERSRQLCQHIGETPQLFRVLRGLGMFYFVAAELQSARELGEQLLDLAQRQDHPTLVLAAQVSLGVPSFSWVRLPWCGRILRWSHPGRPGVG
jgi:predicted ATPase